MKRLILLCSVLLCGFALHIQPQVQAQDDGLNLPTELYVVLNDGRVERFGVGQAGLATITPAETYVLDMGIAPDGQWMAYRTETDLVLSNAIIGLEDELHRDESSAEVPPIRGRGETIAWSPRSDVVAYTTSYGLRAMFTPTTVPQYVNVGTNPLVHLVWSPEGTYLAAEAEGNVWWIYRRNDPGTPPALTLYSAIPSSSGVAWLDDGRLLFAPAEGGLRVLDLNAGSTQTPLLDTTRVYFLPYLREDGTLRVFSRPTSSTPEENTAFLQEITLTNGRASVQSTSENAVDLDNLRWVPRGDLMVAFRGGVLVLLLPGTGQGFPLPITDAVGYSWGALRPPVVTGLTLNNEATYIAPGSEGILQVWRIPANGLPPMQITSAEFDVTAYALHRSRIAYISDGRLWLQTEGSDPVELLALEQPVPELTFNAAGDTLAYTTLPTDEDPQSGIWTIPAAGGEPAAEPQLVLPNGEDTAGAAFITRVPQYALNFNALLVQRLTDAALDYYVLDPVSNEVSTIGRYDSAAWLENGQIVTTFADGTGSGVYTIDPTVFPAEARLVLRAGTARILDVREIRPGVLRVLVQEASLPGLPPLKVLEVATTGGEADEVAALNYMQMARLSPDGAFVAGRLPPDDALAFYNIADAQRVLLQTMGRVTDFRWLFRQS
ncbi:MAG: hypothetical protein OHK0046_15090 [Anaerolineae bacterium]